MKILYLSLKKEWYEMIERGDKREEYRENTRYWKTRLIDTVIYDEGDEETESPVFIFFKDYDAVCFSYGYTRRRMLWECKGVDFGGFLSRYPPQTLVTVCRSFVVFIF